jgi:hypothetical protein
VPDPVATPPVSPAAPVVAAAPVVSGTDPAAPVVAKEGDAPVVKPVGAPDKYADFKLPDGVTLDASEVTDLQTYAKTNNLTQEQAQAVLDRTLKTRSDTEASVVAKQAEALKTMSTEWKATTQADKEIGGDALQANLATAVKARDAFGSPALIQILNDSGMGNHPEVVRFFVKVGKAMSEDKFVQGNANSGTAANPDAARAARMYPSMAPKA